jgi:hypothetical protein
MDVPAGLATPRDPRQAPALGIWSTDTCAPPGSISGRTATLQPLPELRPLRGQNCTVLLTDVVGFSSRDRNENDRLLIREKLFQMTDTMLQDIAEVRSQDRGDGILTIAWPDIPTSKVVERLLMRMLPALSEYNCAQGDSGVFKLRAAIDVGPVVSDIMGFSGDVLINVSRLVDTLQFKRAMDTGRACLGVITTRFVYQTVLQQDAELTGYCPVRCRVKNYEEAAWMRVFDTAISSHSEPARAAA